MVGLVRDLRGMTGGTWALDDTAGGKASSCAREVLHLEGSVRQKMDPNELNSSRARTIGTLAPSELSPSQSLQVLAS